MKNKDLLISIIAVLTVCSAQKKLRAQNLVENGSFEKYNKKQERASDWTMYGSVDFYHPNSAYDFFRSSEGDARSGSGFATFLTQKEVLIGTCKQLEAGHIYSVEFWLKSANYFPRTSTVWVWLSDDRSALRPERFVDPPAQILNAPENYIDTVSWQKLTGEFTAKGHEKFIIISGMSNTPTIRYTHGTGKDSDGPYLRIDDVSITDITSPFQFEADKPIRLENIFFDTGKSELLPRSFAELDKLFAFLHSKSEVKLEIAGHTDSVGKENSNQELSTARAKSVFDFLIKKGIATNRLSYIGYGSTRPVSDNLTTKGRQDNRRVEVRQIK